jgi:hypothetical protein
MVYYGFNGWLLWKKNQKDEFFFSIHKQIDDLDHARLQLTSSPHKAVQLVGDSLGEIFQTKPTAITFYGSRTFAYCEALRPATV